MRQLVFFVFLIISATNCFAHTLPEKWKNIGIPTDGIIKISKSSNENEFHADYKNITRKVLWEKVVISMKKSGYKLVGNAFGGTVLGFIRGADKIAMKIDQSGDTLHLSLFNSQSKGLGSAKLLHGVVFGNYQVEKIN